MATFDETSSFFPVHSTEAADTEVESREESYEDDDDRAEEYESGFDEEDEHTSSQQLVVLAAPPSVAAIVAAEEQTNTTPAVEQLQIAAASTTPSSATTAHVQPRLLPSRLPVRVAASKQVASSSSAPSSAPVSRLSSKPQTGADCDTAAVDSVSLPTSARTLGPSIPSVSAAHAVSKPKAASSSASTSKPPSRHTAKPAPRSSPTYSPSASSSSSSPTSSKSCIRPTAFVKPTNSTSASSSSSPAHKSAKHPFDFSHHKHSITPSTAAPTHTKPEAANAAVSIDSTRPLSPRLAQLQRESHWDPTPFIPPVVPQFATSLPQHSRSTQQPLLDVRQSAWQLQKARQLPTAPNVLLRKPRSEVVTRMSEVVMRTRQLRRRTKDRVGGGVVRGKGEPVQDTNGAGGDVPSLRLATGERVEQKSESRARHNSPLARSRVTGSR